MGDEFIPSHGGQLRETAEWFQIPEESLLDFSASISPIPPADDLIDALCESLRNRRILTQYPETGYADLKNALARYVGVHPGSICLANGVMPLFDAAVRALGLRKCLVSVPAFGQYERVLGNCGIGRTTFRLREQENFSVDPDAVLKEVTRCAVDSVLITNPHSPSGYLVPAGVLMQLQLALSALGVTLILDEAFIDYSPEVSLSGVAADGTRVIVLRSLTKFFAMPGLRVAYSVAHPENRAAIESMLPLWPVDSLAASAACLALIDPTLAQKTREANACDRLWLTEQMVAFGLHVFPASANYLLVRLPDRVDGREMWRRLIVEHRIVVRNCATFQSLTEQYFRIAVRDRIANQALISALAHLL
jgi:threonine-phosphate decarboxylase